MAVILQRYMIEKALVPYVQSGNLSFLIGSGASFPAIELAGNIENEIDQMLEDGDEDFANLVALEFIENIESKNKDALSGRLGDDGVVTIGRYENFFSTIDRLLFERKNHLLSRQANIFTTNYDLFIEHACSKIPSMLMNDGFDRKSSVIGQYRFSSDVYSDRTFRSGQVYVRSSEIPTLNLFKLHGSVNWARDDEGVFLRNRVKVRLTEDQKGRPDLVWGALKERSVILPNLKKFGSTIMDHVYYDLLRFFANRFDKENSVLFTVGFSFSDEHILEITKRGLRNPTSQLVIFSYSREESEKMEGKFSSHRNVLIVNPENEENCNIEEVTQIFSAILGDPGREE